MSRLQTAGAAPSVRKLPRGDAFYFSRESKPIRSPDSLPINHQGAAGAGTGSATAPISACADGNAVPPLFGLSQAVRQFDSLEMSLKSGLPLYGFPRNLNKTAQKLAIDAGDFTRG